MLLQPYHTNRKKMVQHLNFTSATFWHKPLLTFKHLWFKY
uniref:Uncharacterized protein n=1 Tax=Siphoviridae sp. ctrKX6 TaxID=2826476 RepID=A0A8S5NJ09_9CAUD|nr:MAG TPA: hypothetical protein [Siphoviridae sp. ctrKX6]